MLNGRLPPRGDVVRIALIHAVYAGGWALVSLAAGGVSPAPAVALLLFAVALVVGVVRQLRRRAAVPAMDADLTRWVRRVNIVTALAALLYGWALSGVGQEGKAVAAVLVILGLHFLPMWLLLRRASLLAIGVALVADGMWVWHAPGLAASGAFAAALVFAGNGVRLALRTEREERA